MRHRPDDEMNEFFDRERAKLSSSGSSYEYVSPEYIAKAEKWGPRCGQKPKEEGMVETILPMISDDEDSYSDDERQREGEGLGKTRARRARVGARERRGRVKMKKASNYIDEHSALQKNQSILNVPDQHIDTAERMSQLKHSLITVMPRAGGK